MHQAKSGFTTATVREQWLLSHQEVKDDETTRSLVANENIETPLYPWQIYSLIGWEGCHKIVHAFYTRVYNDTEVTSQLFKTATLSLKS